MPSAAQTFAALRKLSPAGAVAYLQQRGQLTKTFSWQDLWQDEHAQQFTVSRLARLDLVQSLRDQIVKSVGGDLSRRDFMRNGEELLTRSGWWGKRTVKDEATGEDVTTTFDPARLKLIYDVNTRMAYAAGQWERLERTRKTHPYLRYITKRDERVRAAHRAWDNVTLPVDHEFWQTHYPPNGWRCRCRVVAVSQREYDRGQTPAGGPLVKTAPEVQTREWVNRRSGVIEQVPVGIDPGFGFNVGAASARAGSTQQLVAERLRQVDPGLARAARNAGMEAWHTRSEVPSMAAAFLERARSTPRNKQPVLALGPVSAMAAARAQAFGMDLAGKSVSLDHDGALHALKQHGGESERKRGQIPVTAEDLARFRELFNRARLRPGDPPVAADGSKVVEGEAVLGGVVYHLVARVRRNHIVPLTMFKRAVQK